MGGSGVASVSFLVDGSVVGSDTSSPYTYNWDSSSVGNGSHSLSARAVDNAGNQSTLSSVNVTVANVVPDVTAPNVALTTPANGSTVFNTVNLSASASDNVGGSGVASVSFLVDGSVVGSDTSSPYTYNWDSSSVGNGSHSLSARAVDNAGNQSTLSSVNVTVANVVPDVTAPNVALTTPANGSTVSNTVNLSASASDNVGGSGVASVSFLVDGSVVGSDTSSPYTYNWDSSSVGNGSHSLSARAVDNAGNQSTLSSVNVTVANVPQDPFAPSVALISPTPDTTVSGTLVVSAMATAKNWRSRVTSIEFMVDGKTVGTVEGRRLCSFAWDSTSVANGSHTFMAKAINRLGKTALSSGVGVMVENTISGPALTSSGPSNLRVLDQ